jgi:hypothetical protein
VHRFLPDLIDEIWNRQINPGRVFDLTLPLDLVTDELASQRHQVLAVVCDVADEASELAPMRTHGSDGRENPRLPGPADGRRPPGTPGKYERHRSVPT